jgi:formylglycine-generating enzyme required for sulfatase activity
MKRILVLAVFPLLLGMVAFVGPGGRVLSQESEGIPEITGMVFVPAGEFVMGSTLEDLSKKAEQDEYPQHRVWVDAFYIDIHEVTNVQYKLFVDSTGVEPPHLWVDGSYPVGHDGFPVSDISWGEAADYAAFVGKRLPTEAEWEKAARGTDGRVFPWGNKFDPHLVDLENLQLVMNNPGNASPYGALDMAGNVAEWVDGWYVQYPRRAGDEIPKEITTRKQDYPEEKYKVYRGGGFNTFSRFLRCANREREKPDKKWRYIGFRCAIDPPWKND